MPIMFATGSFESDFCKTDTGRKTNRNTIGAHFTTSKIPNPRERSIKIAKIVELPAATKNPRNETPPIPANPANCIVHKLKACEYPIAFQLLPVNQYRKNSVNTQTNGAASIPHEPNR